MTKFRVNPERSQLSIEARSSLHPIHGEASGVRGEAEIHMTDGVIDLSEAPKGRIEIAVEALKSGNALSDLEMRRRIEAKKFPTITCELVRATATAQPNRFRLQGDLTLHGVARRLEAEMSVQLGGDGLLTVDGEYILDARGFDITLPRILGLQVYPDVKVRIRVVAERRNDA